MIIMFGFLWYVYVDFCDIIMLSLCFRYMSEMRAASPILTMHVRCYHYEKKYRTVKYWTRSGKRQTLTFNANIVFSVNNMNNINKVFKVNNSL